MKTVIVGAGIGGLYVAYQLLKTHSEDVLVLEKETHVGGRVETFADSTMRVEAGAGRFSKDHTLFIHLLRELKLYPLLVENGLMSGHYHLGQGVSFIPQSKVDLVKRRMISRSKRFSKKHLQSVSLLDFAKSVLSEEETQFLLDSFGYYSELVIMNAYDSIHLMGELDSENRFYSLRGGLSQVVRELSKRIRQLGGKIAVKKEVCRIDEIRDGFSILCSDGSEYTGHRLVSALPKEALVRIPFFRPVVSSISHGLVSAPLCRIYAKYPIRRNHGPWFKGLKKFTVNNELRMVIPISEEKGIIMISYSDNRFADFWKTVESKYGEDGLNREIQKKIKEVLGIDIPDATHIRLFYWASGVGYWGPGVKSDVVSRNIVRPFPNKNVFVCGEHFSAKYQQWMEGALETGSRVVDLIRRDGVRNRDG